MRTPFSWLLVASASLLTVVACNQAGQVTPTQSPLRPTATIKDIMDSMVDPSADTLWDSVATIVSAAGTEEKQPRTDDDWKKVHQQAVILVEATNLLIMEGRHVAKAGEKAENEEVELSPEEIEKTINQDRKAFVDFAHALHDAAVPALQATEKRDPQALLDAGEKIDTACENCHLKYWYPLSKQAESAKAKTTKKS
jgi:cytochrome c556